MKYHTLFLSKTRKDVSKFVSAAVVIGALRVKKTISVKLNGSRSAGPDLGSNCLQKVISKRLGDNFSCPLT